MRKPPFTFLALGDSYTIGETVPLIKSFPYQTTQLLRQQNIEIAAPEIIAKTGWTTDELTEAIRNYTFLPSYDVVTLLIGVNNQYRGRSADEYQTELKKLLEQAIRFAGGKRNVIVLSIPDYTVTPFAKTMNVEKIEAEINHYNNINKTIAEQYGTHYINITESSREAKNNVSLVAEDGLHPSAEEYQKWAQLLAQKLKDILC